MGGYKVYESVRGEMYRLAKKTVTKEERRKPGFVNDLVTEFMSMGGSNRTLDAATLADETDWLDGGCRTYFPESEALVQVLWRSKMDVTLEDLDLPSFPRAFAVAWPDMEIDGVKLAGCLAWWGKAEDRLETMRKFGTRYMGGPARPIGTFEDPEELALHVSYRGSERVMGTAPTLRCSVPSKCLRACLKSDDEFRANLGMYKCPELVGAMDLSEAETRQQYVVVKSLIHLMVYLKARPDSVREGWPDGRNQRDLMPTWMKSPRPSVVTCPGLERDSPSAHWRTWHFRTYPTKRDGTKRDGLVFVSGTMVNAEMKEPRTVELVEMA